jgi:hypothetical protein
VTYEDPLMPKLHCPCGFVHELSTIPDRAWVTFRDADHDRLVAAEQTPEPEKAIAPLLGRMYECPDCGRLMWSPPGSDDYQVYAPDKGAV